MAARRVVQFVVASKVWTAAMMLEHLGPPDEPVEGFGDTTGRPGGLRVLEESSWVVSSGLGESASVEAHLAALHRRVRPTVKSVPASMVGDVASVLRIVQYLPSGENQGHGFTIGSEWVSLLHEINGVIDVDQYVSGDAD